LLLFAKAILFLIRFSPWSLKDNIAKYCFDVSKIMLAITVITPITKKGFNNPILIIGGLWVAIVSFLIAYVLDSKELK